MKLAVLAALLSNALAYHDGTPDSSHTHWKPYNGSTYTGTTYNNGYYNNGSRYTGNTLYTNTYLPATSCTSLQIRSTTGSCVSCPAYTRAQGGNTRCAGDTCSSWQTLASDGTCSGVSTYTGTTYTGSYARPSYTGNTYTGYYTGQRYYTGNTGAAYTAARNYNYQASCNARQRRSPDGTYCIDCPTYTRATNNNASCASNSCTGYRSIVLSDGSCSACTGSEVPDNQRRSCIVSGSMYGYAGSYYYPTVAQAVGQAAPYAPAYVGVPQDQAAVTINPANAVIVTGPEIGLSNVCTDRQFRNLGGACEYCPSYTRAQEGNRYCWHDVCRAGQIQTYAGQCKSCSNGQVPDSTGRTCLGAQIAYVGSNLYCASNQILDAYGGCVNCPSGAFADGPRRNCVYQSASTIRFIAVASDLEGPASIEEEGSNAAAIFVALGVVIVLLSVGTGTFIYKNKYNKLPESREAQYEVNEVELEADKEGAEEKPEEVAEVAAEKVEEKVEV